MELLTTIIAIVILIFSASVHEMAHGAAADALGDPTARNLGRLTINPIKHLDLLGSVIVPLFLVLSRSTFFLAWAKPVPFNPYLLKDQRYGPAKVALAGPVANLLIAVIFGLIIRLTPLGLIERFTDLFLIFAIITQINITLAVFNLMPVPPLDGSHILFAFLPASLEKYKFIFMQMGVVFLVLFVLVASDIIVPIVARLFWLLTGVPLY